MNDRNKEIEESVEQNKRIKRNVTGGQRRFQLGNAKSEML